MTPRGESTCIGASWRVRLADATPPGKEPRSSVRGFGRRPLYRPVAFALEDGAEANPAGVDHAELERVENDVINIRIDGEISFRVLFHPAFGGNLNSD